MGAMTEDEARTKWCPKTMVLESYAENTSYNRLQKTESEPHHASVACIGSACMAWRWTAPATVAVASMMGGLRIMQKEGEPARGYCGAFGEVR